jgi:ribosomal protein S18 acetylase RimI-like enzyme
MFQIRQCRAEHFDAVVQLLRQLWPERPLDLASLQAVFDKAIVSESQVYLCAIEGEAVVGFGSLTIKNNLWHEGYLGHIDELIVESAFRGRGIGTQLLDKLLDAAQRRGCRRVELDSAFHRKQAHEFYARQGFESRALLFSKVL